MRTLQCSPTPGLQETCKPCKSQAQRSRRRAALPPLSLRLKTNRGNQPSSETCSVIAGLFVCCWWNSLNLTITRRTQRWRAATLLGYLIHSSECPFFPVTLLYAADTVSSRQSRPHRVSTCSPAHLFSMVILCLNAVFLTLQRWGGVSHLYPRLKQSNKEDDW